MMKKTGFTLAEVLITLSIIGIVAMMTLPALMTNVQEQQAKTGLKKGLNTLIEAAQMNQAIEGFDYASLANNAVNENEQSMTGIMLQRTQVDTAKSFSAGTDGTFAANTTGAEFKAVGGRTTDIVIFFRDGSALMFPSTIVDAGDTYKATQEKEEDGLPSGFVVLYDINGEKAPNVLSNCNGDLNLKFGAEGSVAYSLGANESGDADEDYAPGAKSFNTLCTKSNKVIKDQFYIRLRGAFAQPEGAAAWYAFNH